jgi:hypothetical protein
MFFRNLFAAVAIASVVLLFSSCNKSGDGASVVSDPHKSSSGHTHEAWWCDEHGVPEEVCALCDTSLVADFKAKGDWCEKHNRPDSQCFICHPEKQAEFAALYEAKYGKQPPAPAEDEKSEPGSQDKT